MDLKMPNLFTCKFCLKQFYFYGRLSEHLEVAHKDACQQSKVCKGYYTNYHDHKTAFKCVDSVPPLSRTTGEPGMKVPEDDISGSLTNEKIATKSKRDSNGANSVPKTRMQLTKKRGGENPKCRKCDKEKCPQCNWKRP